MSTALFLTLRVLHVLLAASWIGATVFTTFLLMPAMNISGTAGDQIMVSLQKKGMGAFFGAVGGITVLTGIYLFWHFTGGFDPEVSRSNAGMAYSIGGAAGLLAVILGGSLVGRSSAKVVDLLTQLPTVNDAGQKAAMLQQVETLKGRMSSIGLLVLGLQVVALALMAIGHYI